MHQTLDDIRREGLSALRKRLGRSGLVRFLQQFELGSGDYARQRRAWVDQTSFSDLKHLSARGPAKKRKASKPSRPRHP
jgi:hypothetical protein